MGRTLPSITQAFLQEQQSLAKFRRALRLEDQRALDDILAASRQHLAAAAYASHLLPFEVMLLAMLVEEHKEVMRLRSQVEALLAEQEKSHLLVVTQGSIGSPTVIVRMGIIGADLNGLVVVGDSLSVIAQVVVSDPKVIVRPLWGIMT